MGGFPRLPGESVLLTDATCCLFYESGVGRYQLVQVTPTDGEGLRADSTAEQSFVRSSGVDVCGCKLARWFKQQTSPPCDESVTRSKDRDAVGGGNSHLLCVG